MSDLPENVVLRHNLKNPAVTNSWIPLADIEQEANTRIYELKVHGKLADQNSVSVSNTTFKNAGYNLSLTGTAIPGKSTYLPIATNAVGLEELYVAAAGLPTSVSPNTPSAALYLPIADNSIISSKIAPGAINNINKINTDNIKAGGVNGIPIAEGAIQNQHLAIGGISGERLTNNTVTLDKLNTRLKGVWISNASPDIGATAERTLTFWSYNRAEEPNFVIEYDDNIDIINEEPSFTIFVDSMNLQRVEKTPAQSQTEAVLKLTYTIKVLMRYYWETEEEIDLESVDPPVLKTVTSKGLTRSYEIPMYWIQSRDLLTGDVPTAQWILSKAYFQNIIPNVLSYAAGILQAYKSYINDTKEDGDESFNFEVITKNKALELANSFLGLNGDGEILPELLPAYWWDNNLNTWIEGDNQASNINIWLGTLEYNFSNYTTSISRPTISNNYILYELNDDEVKNLFDYYINTPILAEYEKIGIWVEI